MKRTSIISLLIACVTLGTMTTSCEDMLSPESDRHSYVVAQDTLYSYWGILKSWQNVAERYIVLGECRGELLEGTAYISDTISAILNFRMGEATDGSCRFLKASDYYHIINSCNAYLAECDTLRVTGTLQPYMKKEAAQVEAIRAWTYLQLVLNYREVPFYLDPKLSSDELTTFMQAPETVSADNIADKLAENLIRAQRWELEYGFPQYNNYSTCHSAKAMIPLNLIIADLYLTQGDQRSCELAAGYYYDYLSNNQGLGHLEPGGTLSPNYGATGYMYENMERPRYYISSGYYPWYEPGAPSSTTESITAIPSSTSKLDGAVLRGVNELYGYASDISVRTDTAGHTSSSVTLEAKYDTKQLAASKAYFTLCKNQKYEVYTGDANTQTPTVDNEIGDARQVWVQDLGVYYSNGTSSTEKFITKMNPLGYQSPYPNFSPVSHVIYRKSMVWLRFAEALCGAGYPSFAFAILKNGLCKNDDWYPSATDDYTHIDIPTWYLICADGTIIPENYKDGDISEIYQTKEELEAYVQQKITDLQTEYSTLDAEYKALDAEYKSLSGDEKAAKKIERDAKKEERDAKKKELDKVQKASTDSKNYQKAGYTYVEKNYPYHEVINDVPTGCDKVLIYLDRRELQKNPRFINFNFEEFQGKISLPMFITYRSTLRSTSSAAKSIGNEGEYVSCGVHSRGCGLLKYNEQNSSYNYVDLVMERSKAYNNGIALTQDEIYDGTHDDIVRKCVEDIIVDEEALELAFEGTRFFDLVRVAHRRMRQGDPKAEEWFADHIALRDPSLKGKLMNYDNWFFPLPAR